jgi:hypothetical protein
MTSELDSLQRIMNYLKGGGIVHFAATKEDPIACSLPAAEWASDDWIYVNCPECQEAAKSQSNSSERKA